MQFLLQGLTVGLMVAVYLSFKQAKDAKKQGNTKLEKTHKMIGIICSVAFVVVFGLSITHAVNRSSGNIQTTAWQTQDNSSMAYVMMQEFGKDNLKSPASAKFPWMNDQNVKIERDGFEYAIQGYVDSQNTFGAMIRTRFAGVVRQADKENWELLALDFAE